MPRENFSGNRYGSEASFFPSRQTALHFVHAWVLQENFEACASRRRVLDGALKKLSALRRARKFDSNIKSV